MADSERFQAPQLTPEVPVDLRQAQQGIGLHGTSLSLAVEPSLGDAVELLVQGAVLAGLDGETTRSGVATKALQMLSTGLKGLVHSETSGCSNGGAKASFPLASKEGGRAVVTVHQPCSDDPDHTVVPMALGKEQEGGQGPLISLNQSGCFSFNRITEVTTLTVEVIALASQRHRRILISLR